MEIIWKKISRFKTKIYNGEYLKLKLSEREVNNKTEKNKEMVKILSEELLDVKFEKILIKYEKIIRKNQEDCPTIIMIEELNFNKIIGMVLLKQDMNDLVIEEIVSEDSERVESLLVNEVLKLARKEGFKRIIKEDDENILYRVRLYKKMRFKRNRQISIRKIGKQQIRIIEYVLKI